MKSRTTLLVLALTAAFAERAVAQSAPERSGEKATWSLKARVGVEGVRRPLRAESSALRQRAFERLGSMGTNAALALLEAALAPGGEARDARERLVAVRALAPHVDREIAVDALVRALAGAQTKEDPRETLVEQTAALALARSNRPRAQQALAQALRQPGRVSETAALAFLAHPPSSSQPLLEAAGLPTPALVRLLGELGDVRAAAQLASLASGGPPELRAEALLSLARLDRARALVIARAAALAEPTSTLGVAAVRVLVDAGDPRANEAFSALLGNADVRESALRLAITVRREELGASLSRLEPAPDEVELWLAALGRSGGELALARLERNLANPERAWAAAYALARSADSGAEDVLERALERPQIRREALRGAVLRRLSGGGMPGGVERTLDALERSALPADRAAASFARAALDPERGAALLAVGDAVSVCSAARAASEGVLALAAATRLAREKDALLRTCLASSLADTRAADRVPDRTLIELLETGGAATHVAAYALAARDRAELRPRLRELLASSDPGLRAHVALGLAHGRDASAVGMLSEAYRFETEPRVRRALVRALSARREKGRRTTLRLAANLDPDREARDEARRALGALPPSASRPDETAWIRLDPRDPARPASFAVLETSEGLALPALPDPDGTVLFWPLPAGEIVVDVAVEPDAAAKR